MPEPMVIDGSQGEGGGQILRTTVSLAAALGRDVRIVHIRAGRDKPGLRPQHLAAVRATAQVCRGKLIGDEVGSSELCFAPGAVCGGPYTFDMGTAGSTVLVLQTLIPPLMLAGADSVVTVTGGTHNPKAPCFEYLRDVFGVLAGGSNLQSYFSMDRPGFYPAGGGQVQLAVSGLEALEDVSPVRFVTRGDLRWVEVLSAASGSLPKHIVQRQAAQATRRLEECGIAPRVQEAQWDTLSPGTAVFVRAVFSRSAAGFCALGKRGKPAEQVADEAVSELMDFLSGGGAVDAHAGDQLLTLAALCVGASRFTCRRATSHLRTNAAVVRQLTGRDVAIEEMPDGSAAVTVAPMGDVEESVTTSP